MHNLYTLHRAGYPFRANDLTLDEWNDLAVMREEFERLKPGAFFG